MDSQVTPQMSSEVGRLQLKVVQPVHPLLERFETITPPKTANEYFSQKFNPWVFQFGAPVLEHKHTDLNSKSTITPVALNELFFASILGGDPRIGHRVIYFTPEGQWYFREPLKEMFFPSTDEKLINYLDAMIVQCAQELPPSNNIGQLFLKLRSPQKLKEIVNRAKSVLAADQTFFSPTSIYRRAHGPEVYLCLTKQFVKASIEPAKDADLTVTQVFELFVRFCREQGLDPIKRKNFREIISQTMRDEFDLGIRNDVIGPNGRSQSGFKGVRYVDPSLSKSTYSGQLWKN